MDALKDGLVTAVVDKIRELHGSPVQGGIIRVHGRIGLAIDLSIRTSQGPRHFSVKVTEHLG